MTNPAIAQKKQRVEMGAEGEEGERRVGGEDRV